MRILLVEDEDALAQVSRQGQREQAIVELPPRTVGWAGYLPRSGGPS